MAWPLTVMSDQRRCSRYRSEANPKESSGDEHLGPDYHALRIYVERRMRNQIAQLSALGYRVTIEPAA